MTADLAKRVHKQLVTTFRGRAKKGYNWLNIKFQDTNLERATDELGQQMLNCLTAKHWGYPCPVHQRLHDLI